MSRVRKLLYFIESVMVQIFRFALQKALVNVLGGLAAQQDGILPKQRGVFREIGFQMNGRGDPIFPQFRVVQVIHIDGKLKRASTEIQFFLLL